MARVDDESIAVEGWTMGLMVDWAECNGKKAQVTEECSKLSSPDNHEECKEQGEAPASLKSKACYMAIVELYKQYYLNKGGYNCSGSQETEYINFYGPVLCMSLVILLTSCMKARWLAR